MLASELIEKIRQVIDAEGDLECIIFTEWKPEPIQTIDAADMFNISTEIIRRVLRIG